MKQTVNKESSKKGNKLNSKWDIYDHSFNIWIDESDIFLK